jgi:hypothetical protein
VLRVSAGELWGTREGCSAGVAATTVKRRSRGANKARAAENVEKYLKGGWGTDIRSLVCAGYRPVGYKIGRLPLL